MNTTALIDFLQKGVEFIKPTIELIVGGLIATMFLRKNTSIGEFEKIKSGFFQEVTEDLLKNGKITYYEFYKCNNFLKIAKYADEYFKEKEEQSKNNATSQEKFDFDWFIQFYESSSNISDDEMQKYWGKLLANAVHDNSIQKRIYIDIIARLSHFEAIIIEKIYSLPFDEIQHKPLLAYNLPDSIEFLDEKTNICLI